MLCLMIALLFKLHVDVGKVKGNNISDIHKKRDEKVFFQKIFAIKKNSAASKLKKSQADRNRVTHELEIL